jgi:hypothetical protein
MLKMVKFNLGIGLPSDILKGDIKCRVCMIAKGTRTNTLKPTYWLSEVLGIVACDLMSPFEIPSLLRDNMY